VIGRVRTGYEQRLLGEGRGGRKARVGSINLKISKVILRTSKNESSSRVFIFLHEKWGGMEGAGAGSKVRFVVRHPG